jgi:predicted DNA-binding transcriptional regulator YafY
VSRRTVYRDLEALAQLGVPLVATPGQGYSLAPGYHLPPVMLTSEEAAALALAGGLFRHFVAHEDRRALDTALQKVDAALPSETRASAAEACRRVCLISWPHRAAPLDGALPRLIRQAIEERRRLAFTYHSRSTGETGEREIDPHSLVYYAGDWHLVGYCHQRADVRQFRLARIEGVRLLDARFVMPDAADARDFWANRDPARTGERVARVLFSPDAARWARERRHYACEGEEETAAGLVMTLRVDRWEELIPWLLGWGGDARVLSPPELCTRVREEACRMLARYDEK